MDLTLPCSRDFKCMREQPNIATRGIPFELALAFEWANALIVADTRKDYGERRFQAIGLIAGRVHVLVFTPRWRSYIAVLVAKTRLERAAARRSPAATMARPAL